MAHFLTIFLFIALWIISVDAKDLGRHGHTFSIQEEDLLTYLQQKLAAISPEQQEEINQKIQQHFMKGFEEPKPVAGLKETTTHKMQYFDPTVTIKSDVRDASGICIIKKGTTYNPLTAYSLPAPLLFFDGDNPEHLLWARKQPHAVWILVKGKPLMLEKQENRPIYFDQQGFLTRRFKLTHIPTVISQEGLQLKIEQIPV